jgi:hypothetical protein
MLTCFFLPGGALSADEAGSQEVDEPKIETKAVNRPVLRIPLRIHLGKSAWRPVGFLPLAEEINSIWLMQAGICFEIELVQHDRPALDGFDLWFMPVLEERPSYNGLFKDVHNIYVRDVPILGPAKQPAHSSTARTAAHEMGHALGLHHRQESDDNLMRSKTYGWQLSAEEIQQARRAAFSEALPDQKPFRCRVVIKKD